MAGELHNTAHAANWGRSGPVRINPDSIVTLWLTVGLVCFLAVASFMVSFTGLHEVAAWAGLPVWLRWAVPVFIDVAILAYTMAVLIHRHRGERTWASWVSLAGFTLFSVVANGAHALSIDHPDDGQRIIGAAVASMAPVAVFAATEQLGRLVIRRPERQQPTESLPIPETNGADKPVGTPIDEGQQEPRHQIGAPVVDQGKDPDQSDPLPALPPSPAEEPPVADDPSGEYPASVTAADPGPAGVSRPVLSVVGRKPKTTDFQAWVSSLVASGSQPTGKDAAEFLGVSERTGRARLNALKKADPELFEGASLKRGTNP